MLRHTQKFFITRCTIWHYCTLLHLISTPIISLVKLSIHPSFTRAIKCNSVIYVIKNLCVCRNNFENSCNIHKIKFSFVIFNMVTQQIPYFQGLARSFWQPIYLYTRDGCPYIYPPWRVPVYLYTSVSVKEKKVEGMGKTGCLYTFSTGHGIRLWVVSGFESHVT